MRTPGTPFDLERRRVLAVTRILDGYAAQEVADFLGVDGSSVRRWWAAFRRHGMGGLAARPAPGRPPKLDRRQERIVRRWLRDSPLEHGFATELWSAPRLARLIAQEWSISLHPHYLAEWLRARGLSPQKPRRRARERDGRAIRRWLACDWPRIKKTRDGARLGWCPWTRAGC